MLLSGYEYFIGGNAMDGMEKIINLWEVGIFHHFVFIFVE